MEQNGFDIAMHLKWICVVIAALYCRLSTTACDSVGWTVDDCIVYAMEHSYDLRNKRIDTDMARADLLSVYGDFLPSVSVTGRSGRRLGHSVDPSTNQYTSESFWDNTVGLNVSLPIFEGLVRINRVKFARLNKAISYYDEKVAENALALEIAEAYYRCSFDVGMYELAMERRRLSERYFEKMTEYIRLGMRPCSDLSELKARLQADRYQERVKARGCKLSMSALRELMGMEVADTLCLSRETVADTLLHDGLELTGLYESARVCMPEYKIMKMRCEASRKSVSMAVGSLYPSVRMEFSVNSGCNTARNGTGGVPSLGSQMKNNLNRYVGISVAVPLFDGVRRYKEIQKEKMRNRQVINENERQRQAMESDIYDTLLSAQTALEERRLAEEQLSAASVLWHQNEEKWHEGLISGFELMESRDVYMQARMELVRARLQCALSERIIHYYRTGSFNVN